MTIKQHVYAGFFLEPTEESAPRENRSERYDIVENPTGSCYVATCAFWNKIIQFILWHLDIHKIRFSICGIKRNSKRLSLPRVK